MSFVSLINYTHISVVAGDCYKIAVIEFFH
jgi:hypothetical protein